MPANIAEQRRIFRALHESGCFVIPNPWDVGSAKMLDLDRAASEQEPLTKPETAGDDSATGEFAAVASPPPGDVTNTPSHNDLSELASRQGLK